MRVQQDQRPNNTSAHNQSLLRRKQIKTFENHEKKRRRKPGTVALRQIKFYQGTTCTLVQKTPFHRMVREIADSLGIIKFQWKSSALEALQIAVETYMTALFEDCNKAAIHGKRVTIRPEDLRLVRSLRSQVNPNEIY